MPDIVKEEAKKELDGILKDAKDSQMTEEEKKTQADEATKAAEEETRVQEQKDKDAAILEKKEEERTPEEVERAKVALEEKKKEEARIEEKKKADEDAKLSADDKIKRIKDKTDKRIGELTTQLKQVENKHSDEGVRLQGELDALRVENEKLRKTQPTDLKDQIIDQENKRIAKYASEDEGKDRENRREMSKDELDDWYLEDAVSATEWMQNRILRRGQERSLDYKRFVATDMATKQKESLKRAFARYPEYDIKARTEKLKAEGKSEQEIKDIMKADPKLNMLWEIGPKFISLEDGPEKSMAEVERRLKAAPVTSETDKKIADLTEKVESANAKIEELEAEKGSSNSDEGLNSTVRTRKVTESKLTVSEQSLEDTMRDAGAPEDRIKSALKKFRDQQKR